MAFVRPAHVLTNVSLPHRHRDVPPRRSAWFLLMSRSIQTRKNSHNGARMKKEAEKLRGPFEHLRGSGEWWINSYVNGRRSTGFPQPSANECFSPA
jgi:hypothetical protein